MPHLAFRFWGKGKKSWMSFLFLQMPYRGFVDGDAVEAVLDLPPQAQSSVFAALKWALELKVTLRLCFFRYFKVWGVHLGRMRVMMRLGMHDTALLLHCMH